MQPGEVRVQIDALVAAEATIVQANHAAVRINSVDGEIQACNDGAPDDAEATAEAHP